MILYYYYGQEYGRDTVRTAMGYAKNENIIGFPRPIPGHEYNKFEEFEKYFLHSTYTVLLAGCILNCCIV